MEDNPWDARAAVARILACDPDELTYREEWAQGVTQVHYERAGEPVGRLVVAGPLGPMDGTPDRYFEITFQGVDGSAHSFEKVRDTGIDY